MADALRGLPISAELADDDLGWIIAEGDEVVLAPASAVGGGSIAAQFTHRYLAES